MLSDTWINISTLVKGNRMMLPLQLSKYHLNKLNSCNKIIDCEIVKKRKKYYANFTCEYTIPDTNVQYFRTVDLGILRSMSTVLFDCKGALVKNSFKVFNDNKKHAKLNELDIKIKELQ